MRAKVCDVFKERGRITEDIRLRKELLDTPRTYSFGASTNLCNWLLQSAIERVTSCAFTCSSPRTFANWIRSDRREVRHGRLTSLYIILYLPGFVRCPNHIRMICAAKVAVGVFEACISTQWQSTKAPNMGLDGEVVSVRGNRCLGLQEIWKAHCRKGPLDRFL